LFNCILNDFGPCSWLLVFSNDQERKRGA